MKEKLQNFVSTFSRMQFDIDNFLTAIASCTDCNVAASLAFLHTRGFFLRHALLT